MFTGLIEEIGIIKDLKPTGCGIEFEIKANFTPELKIGDSVAINGACQSVISIKDNSFRVFAMKESLDKTNFKFLKKGDSVNLERAMILGSRLDGHIVQGHIDGVGKLINKTTQGASIVFEFSYPTTQIVKKGSIAINGVSLTVSDVKKDSFCVSLIPQTLDLTTFKNLKIGDFVNIETDIFAKYIEKFLSAKDNESKLSVEFLMENGF